MHQHQHQQFLNKYKDKLSPNCQLKMEAKFWCRSVFVTLLAFVSFLVANGNVLTLDHSNFTHIVSKHNSLIVVKFYAPWCEHSNALAPEYDKAASVLSSHDPPIVLAKVDAHEEVNMCLATEYEVQGYPTIKIFKNGGKISQDYKGPRDAEGIVDYLKKQVGPLSVEIKSAEDAASFIDEKNIFVVGVFPKFSGEEFENFMALADKFRSDYTFAHTLDAKNLPHGEVVNKPTIRVFKPFDELFVDSQDFEADTMEKFIEEATTPIVTVWNSDPNNHPYINKFFENSNAKAKLFVSFTKEHDSFEPIYKQIAALYKGKGIRFLLGDADVTQNAFMQYFGLSEEQAPVLIIQDGKGNKYLKEKIEPNQIESWMKDYTDGKIKPFIRSEPIPEINNEPVKVVVRDSLLDVVFNSGKNVLLEFYAPWCGHYQQLAPILDEVAISFENDPDIIVAKFDATANDVPSEIFNVQGSPTLYFISSSGSLSQYEGDGTKEDIIDFIQKNKNKPSQSISGEKNDCWIKDRKTLADRIKAGSAARRSGVRGVAPPSGDGIGDLSKDFDPSMGDATMGVQACGLPDLQNVGSDSRHSNCRSSKQSSSRDFEVKFPSQMASWTILEKMESELASHSNFIAGAEGSEGFDLFSKKADPVGAYTAVQKVLWAGVDKAKLSVLSYDTRRTLEVDLLTRFLTVHIANDHVSFEDHINAVMAEEDAGKLVELEKKLGVERLKVENALKQVQHIEEKSKAVEEKMAADFQVEVRAVKARLESELSAAKKKAAEERAEKDKVVKICRSVIKAAKDSRPKLRANAVRAAIRGDAHKFQVLMASRAKKEDGFDLAIAQAQALGLFKEGVDLAVLNVDKTADLKDCPVVVEEGLNPDADEFGKVYGEFEDELAVVAQTGRATSKLSVQDDEFLESDKALLDALKELGILRPDGEDR